MKSSNAPTAWSRFAMVPWSGRLQKADIDHDRMIRLMIGRDLKALYTVSQGGAGR